MMRLSNNAGLQRGAAALVADHMSVAAGESVLITADTASDMAAVEAVLTAAHRQDARPMVALIPQLPFQGKLADPYLPGSLSGALQDCDVWIDMTHPFIAGSDAHDKAMKGNRLRGLGAGGLDSPGLARLYGAADLDGLFAVQSALDRLIVESAGKTCRLTDDLGTDVSFVLAPGGQPKKRRAQGPGMNTIPGSVVMLPELKSVRGTIRLVAAMHEYYTALQRPLTLEVDGQIRRIVESGPDARLLDRALRRAGRGGYGYVIHFSIGLHPAARFTGKCFVEDIRTIGANAIGLGMPWWEPGGGENHPDGVVLRQSLAIDGQDVLRDGLIVWPDELAAQAAALLPRFA
jgi:hypothetical protein